MPCGGCGHTVPIKADFKNKHVHFLPNGNLHVPKPMEMEGYQPLADNPLEMEPIWPQCKDRFQSPMLKRDGTQGLDVLCNSRVAMKSGGRVTVKDCSECPDRRL